MFVNKELALAGREDVVERRGEDVNARGDHKHDTPLGDRRLALDDVAGRHRCEQSGQVGRAVGERHQDACVPGREVEVVDLEPGIDATVKAHTNGQNGDGEPTAAAGVGRDDQCNRRPVLADAVGDLARPGVGDTAGREHPVRYPADHDREQPHRQLGHQGLVAVVLTQMRQQDRVERHRLGDAGPRDRWNVDSRVAPERLLDVLLLVLAHARMRDRVLVAGEQERDRPDRADDAEHVEDRRPATVEAVVSQQSGQWHRDDCAELGSRTIEPTRDRSFGGIHLASMACVQGTIGPSPSPWMKRTAISQPAPPWRAANGTRKANTELSSMPQPRKRIAPYRLASSPNGICVMT
uniref:Uncharacterized protein n=1 Tax=Anopheles atroparvus TaxID=41427 RepID=A0A182JM67_ANOAO